MGRRRADKEKVLETILETVKEYGIIGIRPLTEVLKQKGLNIPYSTVQWYLRELEEEYRIIWIPTSTTRTVIADPSIFKPEFLAKMLKHRIEHLKKMAKACGLKIEDWGRR